MNFEEVLTHACAGLDANIQPFVQGREEVTERCSQDDYPCLWQIKNRPCDPVLNGLAEMPLSPQQLMQNLIDTGGQGGVPLGRLPSPEQLNLPTVKHPDVFVRRLACLELPDTRFADLPDTWQHAELVEKVMQHRRSAADNSAERPARITEGDIKKVLQDFSTDTFSNEVNKQWLLQVLKIFPQNRNDPEHLTQILDAAVTDFVQDLRDNGVKHSLSAGALASLALYRYILASTKEK